MRFVRYAETATDGLPTGREVIIVGRDLAPMGYDALAARTLNRASPIKLKLLDARVVKGSMAEMPQGNASFLETTVGTDITVRHIGLVSGGWLPPSLAMTAGNVLMPDRCTLTELRGRFKHGGNDKIGRDFIDWLDDPNAQINPVLLALEGNRRGYPSAAEIESQMAEHARRFRLLLPKATIIGDAPEVLAAIKQLAEEQRASSERTIEFLLATAPLLRHQVSRDRLPHVMEAIAATAHRHGLSLSDISVACAMSAAAVRRGRNAAKRALKFTVANYGREDAFNAMADLRSLKAFAALLAVAPDGRPVLCTSDKDLALVWCGLNLAEFHFADGAPAVKARPLDVFLPNEAGQIYQRLLDGQQS
jgi:hypothetical protein